MHENSEDRLLPTALALTSLDFPAASRVWLAINGLLTLVCFWLLLSQSFFGAVLLLGLALKLRVQTGGSEKAKEV